MLDHPITCTAVLSLLAVLWYHFRQRIRAPRGTMLPPGPKRLPIVGNLFDAPQERSWLTYTNWARTYGDVVYMEIFGGPVIIVNSAKAATELFEKRSTNYADRPRMVMANELMGWGWDLGHMPYSDLWRRHRKMFHQYFQQREMPAYEEIQLETTATLLLQLLERPEDFAKHIQRHSASAILRVVYGYDVKSNHDHYVALVREALDGYMQVINVGSYLVDFLPGLKYIPSWFPGATFKNQAKEWAVFSARLKDRPFEGLKQSMASGPIAPCFVSHNLELLKENPLAIRSDEEEIIKNCAGVAYLAGSDTTASAILTFMLAMSLYPDVQARAQAELVKVIGSSRMPGFGDRSSLPYIEAIFSETLRWGPVAPVGVPHKSMNDDVYDGLYIPGGSTVVGNTWAILHDEKLYPQPFKFKPERFLKEEGKELPPDPVITGAFGFGRRICPGRHFAMNSAWIAIVSILWSFKISKGVDKNGVEIQPDVEYTDGLVSYPKPFKLSLKPLSQEAENSIRSLEESKKE